MRSSTAVLCRALVMLACLVAIPLAAVFGTSLPDMVTALLNGRWDTLSAMGRGSLGEAPILQPFVPSDGPPHAIAQQMPSPWMPTVGSSLSSDSIVPAPMPHYGVVQAGYDVPVDQALIRLADTVDPVALCADGVGVPGVESQAYEFPAITAGERPIPTHGASGRASVGRASVGRASVGRASVDQFTYVQERLRELGATRYLLEYWGDQRELYRFYCRIAIGGNANYTHYFEATDSDPLEAMSRVLRQVEAWRATRR